MTTTHQGGRATDESLFTSTGVRPRLRGIPDVLATLIALPAVWTLAAHAREGTPTLAACVYGVSLIALFTVSATYHALIWPLRIRLILRRIDHAMVYVLIAGTYTPLCWVALQPGLGSILLPLVWALAAAGALKSFAWIHAPRLLNVGLYVGMGWLLLPIMPMVYGAVGAHNFRLLAAGGVAYTVGALIYARQWPNPLPRMFGYHEVFHLFVIGAAVCHYTMVWNLLT